MPGPIFPVPASAIAIAAACHFPAHSPYRQTHTTRLTGAICAGQLQALLDAPCASIAKWAIFQLLHISNAVSSWQEFLPFAQPSNWLKAAPDANRRLGGLGLRVLSRLLGLIRSACKASGCARKADFRHSCRGAGAGSLDLCASLRRSFQRLHELGLCSNASGETLQP